MLHIAQLNVAHLKYPIDHPEISEFVENLDRINALAEKSKGFVWRLKEESSGPDVQFFNDPLTIANMSVWETIEDLMQFAYNSNHKDIMRKRRLWFNETKKPYLVLWWIKENHTPTLREAQVKLNHLHKNGTSSEAFDFRTQFDPAGRLINS